MSDLLDDRLSKIEERLKFNDRLKAVEENIGLKPKEPWWRNAYSVPFLVALIAAISPSVTAVDGYFKNERDANRLQVEQTEKIRQTYLDRVLKPGLSDPEKYNIYSLLVKLKQDSVIHNWAQENLDRTTEKLFAQTKQGSKEIYQTKRQIDSLNKVLKTSIGKERAKYRAKINQLELGLKDNIKRKNEIKSVLGAVQLCAIIHDFADLMSQITPSQPASPEFNITEVGKSNPKVFPVYLRNDGFCIDIPLGEYELSYSYNGIKKYVVRFRKMNYGEIIRFDMQKGKFYQAV